MRFRLYFDHKECASGFDHKVHIVEAHTLKRIPDHYPPCLRTPHPRRPKTRSGKPLLQWSSSNFNSAVIRDSRRLLAISLTRTRGTQNAAACTGRAGRESTAWLHGFFSAHVHPFGSPPRRLKRESRMRTRESRMTRQTKRRRRRMLQNKKDQNSLRRQERHRDRGRHPGRRDPHQEPRDRREVRHP